MLSRKILWRLMVEAPDAVAADRTLAAAAARIDVEGRFPPAGRYRKFDDWWTADAVVPLVAESQRALAGELLVRAARLGDRWLVDGPEILDDGTIGLFNGILDMNQWGRTPCTGLKWAHFDVV